LTSRSPAKSAAGRPHRSSLSDVHQHAEASEEEPWAVEGLASTTAERERPPSGGRVRAAVHRLGVSPAWAQQRAYCEKRGRGRPPRRCPSPSMASRRPRVSLLQSPSLCAGKMKGKGAAAAHIVVAGGARPAPDHPRDPPAAALTERESGKERKRARVFQRSVGGRF
jgi:hypothetical protein